MSVSVCVRVRGCLGVSKTDLNASDFPVNLCFHSVFEKSINLCIFFCVFFVYYNADKVKEQRSSRCEGI